MNFKTSFLQNPTWEKEIKMIQGTKLYHVTPHLRNESNEKTETLPIFSEWSAAFQYLTTTQGRKN